MDRATPRRIGAIEVGFRLVRVLEAADGPLPLKDLSERAGMPSSKAYAYVASFVHEGLLAQDAVTGRYGLGPFAMSLGVAALRQSDLVEVARIVVIDGRPKQSGQVLNPSNGRGCEMGLNCG